MKTERVNVKSMSKKSAELINVIAAARAKNKLGKKTTWLDVENQAAKVGRIIEKFWLKERSTLDLNEYIIKFVMDNYKMLLITEEDYVVGSSESSLDKEMNFEYSLAI